MNVYLYQGTDKDKAIKPIVTDNAMVTKGELYTIDADDNGLLLVAYPNELKTT